MTRRVRNKFPAGYNLTFASRKLENILRMNRRVITNFTAPPKLLSFSHFPPSVSNLQWNSNYTKTFSQFLQYNRGKDDFISFNAIRITKQVLLGVKRHLESSIFPRFMSRRFVSLNWSGLSITVEKLFVENQ